MVRRDYCTSLIITPVVVSQNDLARHWLLGQSGAIVAGTSTVPGARIMPQPPSPGICRTDAHDRRQANHGRRLCKTSWSSEASMPACRRTTASPIMISIMPFGGSAGGSDGDRVIAGLTSTGSSTEAAGSNKPVRSSRRHLNRLLALMPFCYANAAD